MGWTLDCIGHRQWDYLNGGMHGWHQAGLNFEAGPGPEVHATDNTINIDTAPIADLQEALGQVAPELSPVDQGTTIGHLGLGAE